MQSKKAIVDSGKSFVKERKLYESKRDSSIKRYSRSTLLNLRANQLSWRRPNYVFRSDLRLLSIWASRVKNGIKSNLTTDSLSVLHDCLLPEYRNSECWNSISFMERKGIHNKGTHSRERFISHDQYDNSSIMQVQDFVTDSHDKYKQNHTNNRDNSSSHLMPAFAKKHLEIEWSLEKNINENCRGSTIRQHDIYVENPHKYQKKCLYKNQECYSENALRNRRTDRRIGSGRLIARDINWDYECGSIEKKNSLTIPINTNDGKSCNNEPFKRNIHEPSNVIVNDEYQLLETRSHHPILTQNCRNKSEYCNSNNNITHESKSFISYSYSKNEAACNNRFQQINPVKTQKSMSIKHNQINKERSVKTNVNKYLEKNDEPEWFFDGPKSQNDLIDLHGFEGSDEKSDIQFTPIELNTTKSSFQLNSLFEDLANIDNPLENNSLSKENKNEGEISITDNMKIPYREGKSHCLNQYQPFVSDTNEIGARCTANILKCNETNAVSVDDIITFLDIDSLENSTNRTNGNNKMKKIGTSRFSQWFSTTNIQDNVDDADTITNPNKVTSDNIVKEEPDSFTLFLKKNNFRVSVPSNDIPRNVSAFCVADLEAQMRLLNNTFNSNISVLEKTHNGFDISCNEKNGTESSDDCNKDVEGFRKLLEQLNSTYIKTSTYDNKPALLPNSLPVFKGLEKPPEHKFSLQYMPTKKEFKVQIGATPGITNDEHQPTIEEHKLHQLQLLSQIETNPLPSHSLATNANRHFDHVQTIGNTNQKDSQTLIAFTPTSVLRKMTAGNEINIPNKRNFSTSEYCQQQQYTNIEQKKCFSSQDKTNLKAISYEQNIGNKEAFYFLSNPLTYRKFNMERCTTHQQQQDSIHMQRPIPIINHKQNILAQENQYRNSGDKMCTDTVMNTNSSNCTKSIGRSVRNASLEYPYTSQQANLDRISTLCMEQNQSNLYAVIVKQHQQCKDDFKNKTCKHPSMDETFASTVFIPMEVNKNVESDTIQQERFFAVTQTHTPQCSKINENKEKNINCKNYKSLFSQNNKLSQWFSPELLAQASAGKLPLLNINEAVSLEEFERRIQHSSTIVNN